MKYLKAKKKQCLVFSAEWHISESFEGPRPWWPWSCELCACAILSLKNEVFWLVDWIFLLPLRVGVEGKHDDNKHGCDWLECLCEIPDVWNSKFRHPATTPPMIPKRTGWHKVCIALFGNKAIPFSNCTGGLLRVTCNDVWVSLRDDYWECLPMAWLGRDVKARLRLNE